MCCKLVCQKVNNFYITNWKSFFFFKFQVEKYGHLLRLYDSRRSWEVKPLWWDCIVGFHFLNVHSSTSSCGSSYVLCRALVPTALFDSRRIDFQTTPAVLGRNSDSLTRGDWDTVLIEIKCEEEKLFKHFLYACK